MNGLGAHRLGAEPGTEVLAALRERADPDQVQADLDRLDDLERLEQSDAAVAERGVGEPVLGVNGLPPASLSASTWRYSVVTALLQHGTNASDGRAGRVLDGSGDERHAELLLGDEEVEHILESLLVAEARRP